MDQGKDFLFSCGLGRVQMGEAEAQIRLPGVHTLEAKAFFIFSGWTCFYRLSLLCRKTQPLDCSISSFYKESLPESARTVFSVAQPQEKPAP